eukprot:TRINITY_DN18460_c0_g1_i1.p1 TRINITY_DN18460_c0_g1~~TRINITY_DN18460_c0_g1_i1.p1  ORF type:complete len:244 (+),score=65.37 TRINITY_DN18460_c0_g1_i1:30-734(+)
MAPKRPKLDDGFDMADPWAGGKPSANGTLAAGWAEKRTPTGRIYYENAESDERCWAPPPDKTPAELRSLVLQSSFKLSDKDGNESLSKAELGLLLRRLNPSISSSMISQVFESMDVNMDAKISFQEFQNWLAQDPQKDLADSLSDAVAPAGGACQAIFRIWDKDGSGKLDRSELRAVLQKACPDLGAAQVSTLLDQCLQAIDVASATADADGMVDHQEFVKFLFDVTKPEVQRR